MKKKLILMGAAGHAQSVFDSVNDEYEVVGFVDEYVNGAMYGKPVWRKITDIPKYQSYMYHISTGHIELRKRWWEELKSLGLSLATIVDESAVIAKTAIIGEGNYIGKMAVVNAEAIIGNNNVLNTRCLIEHGCMIGNHCNISTASVLNGDVIVNDEAYVGSNSVCNGQLTIGKKSIIGSGAVVVKNVPDNVTVVGVPAQIIKENI